MKPVLATLGILISIWAIFPHSSSGRTVVASYRADYPVSDVLKTGWQYLWNAPDGWQPGTNSSLASGFIGVPENYLPLQYTGSNWTADGDATGGNNAPAGFIRLSATGGHPGPSAASVSQRDRYAIAAFTVPTSGLYTIENSYITLNNASSDGVEVLVFPGTSEAVLRELATFNAAVSFDIEIGHLEAGQTIYVAFGPSNSASFDSFEFDYNIVHYERPSFRDQIMSGVSSGNSLITIIPGRYFVRSSGTYLNVNNFNPSTPTTIVADDVTVIQQTPHRILGLARCSQLTIRGLTLDFDPQLYKQGTVESISNTAFQIRLHQGYPQTLSSNATSGIIYKSSNLNMKEMTSTLYPNTTTEIEPGLYSVGMGYRVPNMAVGDYVTLTDPVGIPHTIYIENSSSIKLENVSIHGSPAFAFLCRNGQQIHLNGVKVIPGKTPVRATVPRLLSSNADGIHFKHAYSDITVENCELAYNGDDTIVLTNSYSPIFEKPQANVLTVAIKSRQDTIQNGDLLYVYNPNSGIREEAIIESIASISLTEVEIRERIASVFPNANLTNSTFERAFEITLDRPVSAVQGGWIAYRNGESTNFLIENNSIRNTRARGILIKASSGVVRTNEVYNAFLPGIQVRPDANYWMEGDFAQNVVIRENDLRRCSIARINGYTPIYVSARGFDSWTPGSGHKNISIIRNRIFNAPSASILVEFADDVTIRSNQIITSHNILGTSPRYSSVIQLERINDVRVSGFNMAMDINENSANMSALIGTGQKVTQLQILEDVVLDSDQDGLPDSWEAQYFGDSTATEAGADPDADGYTNREEFIANLNPLLPDHFALWMEPVAHLRWSIIQDRYVDIEVSESPAGPFVPFVEDIQSNLGQLDLTQPNATENKFYRAKIGP
jgi:hypothetical protein